MDKIYQWYMKGLLTREESAHMLSVMMADACGTTVIPEQLGSEVINYMMLYGDKY